jgi:hypothetical protein
MVLTALAQRAFVIPNPSFAEEKGLGASLYEYVWTNLNQPWSSLAEKEGLEVSCYAA